MAVKDGGSASPEANKLLRDTIAAAKKNNVPADNIKRAIKRATDSADSAGFQSSLFEAYGAGGAR
jgi:transcriptional/translational regulatory protein YebC/TACO1